MRVTQIIAEEKIDEAPVSGIKQGLRKFGAKTLAKVGAKDMARGIAGKVVTGDTANALYSDWREHLGNLEGKPNQVAPAEFVGWLKQNKLPANKVPQAGVLKDKQVQQLIKQAVIASKSLAGQQQTGDTPQPNKTQQTGDTPQPNKTQSISPEMQKQLDALSPEEAKQLAKML